MEELTNAMDSAIKEPVRETAKDFLMSIDSTHNIAGRGTVVTGSIEQGKIKVNEDVHLIGVNRKHRASTITGIETFHKQMDSAEAGDNVGVLLRGVVKEQVKRGMCLSKPHSLEVRRRFDAEIYILKPMKVVVPSLSSLATDPSASSELLIAPSTLPSPRKSPWPCPETT